MELTCVPQAGTAYPGMSVGILSAALNGLFDAATVTVYTAYMPLGSYGNVSAGIETKFSGTITKVSDINRTRVVFECAAPVPVEHEDTHACFQSWLPVEFRRRQLHTQRRDLHAVVHSEEREHSDGADTCYRIHAVGWILHAGRCDVHCWSKCRTQPDRQVARVWQPDAHGSVALASHCRRYVLCYQGLRKDTDGLCCYEDSRWRRNQQFTQLWRH